jgi:hypothetical protein
MNELFHPVTSLKKFTQFPPQTKDMCFFLARFPQRICLVKLHQARVAIRKINKNRTVENESKLAIVKLVKDIEA